MIEKSEIEKSREEYQLKFYSEKPVKEKTGYRKIFDKIIAMLEDQSSAILKNEAAFLMDEAELWPKHELAVAKYDVKKALLNETKELIQTKITAIEEIQKIKQTCPEVVADFIQEFTNYLFSGSFGNEGSSIIKKAKQARNDLEAYLTWFSETNKEDHPIQYDPDYISLLIMWCFADRPDKLISNHAAMTAVTFSQEITGDLKLATKNFQNPANSNELKLAIKKRFPKADWVDDETGLELNNPPGKPV